ncbi:MAG: PD-(D/E)XK nuclease family protein [Caldisericia bacterium]|nr:PD-(D/E)XK nuclease family protein [Caldisericia bacterium]MDD4614704.1 PD-(D/E)XK nuclease family protein [Caldisericia bacterium]
MSYYSISRLQMYNSCPQKYKYRYIDKIIPPKGEVHLNALVGICVHKTLETIYREYMSTNKWLTFEEIETIFLEIWQSQNEENIVIVHISQDPEEFKKEGLQILKEYHEKEKEEGKKDQTIAVERPFFVTLGEYRLKAIIDRIDYRKKDIFIIHDYKTTSHFPERKNLEEDFQLPLYQMAVEETYPDCKEIHLTWHFLRFNKSITITKSERAIEDIKTSIEDNIRTIELDRDYLPQQTPLCDYCPYQDICSAHRHRFLLESMEEYSQEEGFQIVQKLENLAYQIKKHNYEAKKLEDEKKEWEQVAQDFALKNDFSALTGENHVLTIERKNEISFPDSKDMARSALESFLKENNLWERVSNLYGPKVKGLLADSSLDKKILDELMGFSYIKEKVTLRLKQKKI